MRPFSKVSGRPAPLLLDNVDTDQIIPASFLKVVDREGLAEGLFHGWRHRADGSPNPDFILNQPEHRNTTILLVGENFGCGSSREHAAWALQARGFRVILGRSFADIFRNNANRNGLLAVALSPERHTGLVQAMEEGAGVEVKVDLEAQEVTLPGGVQERFEVDPFSRHCMLQGVDPLGHLLANLSSIDQYEAGHPPRVQTGEQP